MSESGNAPTPAASLWPKKGWPQRNYHYLRHRVFPGIWQNPGLPRVREVPPLPNCGGVRVTWTGHAGFLLQFAHSSVVIDPNWAIWHGFVKRQRAPGFALQDLPEVDLVLVSHAHYDHLHKKALRAIQSRHGIVVPRGSGPLVKKLGFSRVEEMRAWDELAFDQMHVIHTPCKHWGARFLHDTHRDFGGYLIESCGKTVFHCGDSAYFDGFRDIGKRRAIDIALMPIGAYGAPSGRDVHLNPEEALQAFLELGAERFIPMHYGTFPLGTEPLEEPLERLLTEADRLGVLDRIIVLEEGLGAIL